MKFYINKIILWLKNGDRRELEFLNNKVNVITGNSDTGKSTILEIIDYCFFGSNSGIADEHIGEFVSWYGLNICINEKCYTIARGEKRGTQFSNKYYFSGIGLIPDLPSASIAEDELKLIIEQEFGITDKVVFPFGGKIIRANTKISFRYFWMFNTQSGDVITHSQTYFDKQHEERYREALPRIFDLATGITKVENLLLSEKIDRLEKEIIKLEKKEKEELIEAEKEEEKIINVIKKAKECNLIPFSSNGFQEDYNNLLSVLDSGLLDQVDFPENDVLEGLLNERQKIVLKIRRLKSFSGRYKKYKKQLEKDADSLRPLEYLKKYIDNIENEEYKKFLDILQSDYFQIKSIIRTKMPFEFDVANKLNLLENQLQEIDIKINKEPKINFEIINQKDRYIALGEIRSDMKLIRNASQTNSAFKEKIEEKKKELRKLLKSFVPLEESRRNTIEALNEYIDTYIQSAKDVFGTYSGYMSSFDYDQKKLNLRKSKSSECAGHTSSSVDLFRHICLFLGLHEMIMHKAVSYVAPFLILDQPTRPYFNTSKSLDYTKSKMQTLGKDDWTKVRRIFLMLNNFINNVKKSKYDMQVIVLEHVSVDAWENCEYVHLVDEFDGIEKALIPPGLKV